MYNKEKMTIARKKAHKLAKLPPYTQIEKQGLGIEGGSLLIADMIMLGYYAGVMRGIGAKTATDKADLADWEDYYIFDREYAEIVTEAIARGPRKKRR